MFDAHFSLGFETHSQPAMHIVGLAKCSASEGMLTPKQMMLKILIVRQKTMMVVPLLMQDLPSVERGSLCFVEAEKLHASFGAIGSGWRLSVERFRCVELVSVDDNNRTIIVCGLAANPFVWLSVRQNQQSVLGLA